MPFWHRKGFNKKTDFLWKTKEQKWWSSLTEQQKSEYIAKKQAQKSEQRESIEMDKLFAEALRQSDNPY